MIEVEREGFYLMAVGRGWFLGAMSAFMVTHDVRAFWAVLGGILLLVVGAFADERERKARG